MRVILEVILPLLSDSFLGIMVLDACSEVAMLKRPHGMRALRW
jgi:hypothetical protein